MTILGRWACTIALFLFAGSAQASCFLYLDGIPGESTDPAHTNHCVAESFNWGVSATLAGGATDSVFSDLMVTKRVDRASPELALRCAAGTKVRSVVLACRKPGASFDYLKITLTDAVITGVSIGGSDAASESVSFAYDRIEWEYVPQRADGTAGTVIRRWYDLLKDVGGS